jgi:hypothetical protein
VDSLKWNSDGFVWRECLVRLPSEMTLQDLNDDPGVWSNIQSNAHTALRQFDRVRAVAYDESWMVEATVNYAGRNEVVLAGIKKIDLPKRAVSLFENEDYRVEWAGTGYAVFRKRDNVMIGGTTFAVAEAAKSYLLSQYPTRAVA